MRHLVRVTAAAAAILVATSALALATKPVMLQLKLPKKPVEPRPAIAEALAKGPLSLFVVDARGAEDGTLVGIARESGADVYQWRASQTVIPAVSEFITQIVSGWEIPVAPEADLGLRFEVARYFVTEKSETFGSSYIAEVRFKTSLLDKSGRVLWTGESKGDVKRPGVDGRAVMFNEALSIALRNAVANALSSVKPDAEASGASPSAAPTVIEPDALYADLARLKSGGVADDVLVAYVEQRKLSRPLNVDEILKWKSAGLPDAAIRAATK